MKARTTPGYLSPETREKTMRDFGVSAHWVEKDCPICGATWIRLVETVGRFIVYCGASCGFNSRKFYDSAQEAVDHFGE